MLITDPKKIVSYYRALLERDKSYVGIFFVGVKTTSVFCIATCRARKPKKENVEFYTSFKAAMDNGYRPCKICRPNENANEAPEQVVQAIALVKEHPKEKITDLQLKEKGIRPELVRRWFNKHYGMTFQSYQRMYRINQAFLELKQGKSTTHAAFDASYASLSGFGYTFKKLMGNSPQYSRGKKVILIDRLTTPLGPMLVCSTEKGICLLEFADKEMIESDLAKLQEQLQATIMTGDNTHIQQVKKEIKEYFDGRRKGFNVQTDTPGTAFQHKVWHHLQAIEYGTTTTYQKQAEQIKQPKAVRAVASANGRNRIFIIIPCHRVIGKNGNMTGYAGGIERKRWLIEHEQKNNIT